MVSLLPEFARPYRHPILIRGEAHLPPHPALEQLPLLLNFDMDSARLLTLLLIGVHSHLEGTDSPRTPRLSGAAIQSGS